MKTVLLLSMLLSSIVFARDTYVRGYVRQNGAYVQPYYRTSPDSTPYNNYSTKGNVNPYTGKAGTKDPYKSNSSDYDYGNDGLENE